MTFQHVCAAHSEQMSLSNCIQIVLVLVIIASSAMDILKFYSCTLARHKNKTLIWIVNGVIREEMLGCLSGRGSSVTRSVFYLLYVFLSKECMQAQ